MKATEARKLTEENLKGPVIEPYLRIVHTKIKEAANKGKSSITHPWAGIRGVYPSSDEQEAIWTSLRSDGYKVERHPDPDPGHPASAPYDSIS